MNIFAKLDSAALHGRNIDHDRRAFRWLSPTFFDVKEAYDSIIDLLHPSTGEWIESTEEYKSWLISDSAAILGILGMPGCGVRFSPSFIMSCVVYVSERRRCLD